MDDNSFAFDYRPGAIHHGPDAVAALGTALDGRDRSRALVVCSTTIATLSAVIDPVRRGLGDRLVDVFDGATAGKYLETAVEGANRIREDDIDALVPVGGGSSIDLAKQMSVLANHDRPLEDVVEDALDRETVPVPDDDVPLTDVFAVPTTLPGADLSQVAGVKLSMRPESTPDGEIPSASVSDRRLMPAAVFHDLDLFATTPPDVLARSAMNGYDKGIEMLYTRHRTPVTDAAAIRGVGLLQGSLPTIRAESTTESDRSRMLQGIALAQYGLSTPDAYRASLIHSFGHALSRRYPMQQGVAHAVAAPHALRYLFDHVDGRRGLLAEALGVRDDDASDEATAEAVVSAVAETRDALGLPARLRSLDGTSRDHFPDLAQAVVDDSFMAAAPRGLNPEPADIEAAFELMW